ncbi:MAG: hypothetical protein QOG54_763 [Actinomycetota bacterium]|jgi:hypothetical protein|nr:hypothetical protein [Actinomycetota bacterium]
MRQLTVAVLVLGLVGSACGSTDAPVAAQQAAASPTPEPYFTPTIEVPETTFESKTFCDRAREWAYAFGFFIRAADRGVIETTLQRRYQDVVVAAQGMRDLAPRSQEVVFERYFSDFRRFYRIWGRADDIDKVPLRKDDFHDVGQEALTYVIGKCDGIAGRLRRAASTVDKQLEKQDSSG